MGNYTGYFSFSQNRQDSLTHSQISETSFNSFEPICEFIFSHKNDMAKKN